MELAQLNGEITHYLGDLKSILHIFLILLLYLTHFPSRKYDLVVTIW